MTLKAKFEIGAGPTIPSPATVQFICDGNTLSGVDMMLDSFGYKLSLKKNKCITGIVGNVSLGVFIFCVVIIREVYSRTS
jgi:hypothetical protein